MSNEKIRVVTPHQAVGDIPDYHEWVYERPARCDKRGRSDPQMAQANWQFWRCDNWDCPAQAFVPNSLIVGLIEAVSGE